MRKLKLFFACLLMAVLSIGQMWGTDPTYKLTQVSSVSAGNKYVFVQDGYAMNNTVSSSALQTTNSYETTGLAGNEDYVWTLETATNGFKMRNVALNSNYYLTNSSSTGVSFGSSGSVWAFNFQTGGNVEIQNTSNSDRFLGFTNSTSHAYKAYATSNMSGTTYPHVIYAYVLEEETAPAFTIAAQSNDNSKGTVSLSGTVITGSPKSGCRYASPAYTVTSGTATVAQSGNAFTVTPSSDCTVRINFEAIPTHNIIFNNGVKVISNAVVAEGASYAITEAVEDALIASCTYKHFEGWTLSSSIADASVKPALVNSIDMEGADVNLYAVYSVTSGGGSNVSEETASVTISEYATAHSWGSSSSEGQKEIVINSDITASLSSGTNTGKYYNDGWRTYQTESATLTISAADGCELTSATFTYTVNNTGALKDGTTSLTSGTAYEISGSSKSFSVGNSGSATNGQVRFTAISVNYEKTTTGTTTYSLDAGCAAPGQCVAPTFNHGTGTYNVAQSIELATTTEDADIYYTVDGSVPSKTNGTKYTAAFSVSENKTVKAIAVKAGNDDSDIAEAVFTFKPVTPSITKDVRHFMNTANVTIECETTGAAIHYTVDGSDPTASSPTYSTPFEITATTTVKAIAVKTNWDNSDIASETFTKATVLSVADARNAIDETPAGINNQYVEGTIYQIDGYNSTYHSITYWISDDGTSTNGLEVYSGKGLNGADFAAQTDLSIGDVVIVSGTLKKYNSTYEFDKNNEIVTLTRFVAAPTFSPEGSGFLTTLNVSLETTEDGAEIRYTVDGSDPTSTSTLYSEPIELSATTTIKAATFKGEDVSAIITKTYTKATKITVTAALEALDSENPIENQCVYGVVSTAPAYISSGKLIYSISVNGEASNQLKVYNGKGLNGANFANKTDIQVGDLVTVFGTLKIYNEEKEFDAGNYLLEFKRLVDPELEWSAASFDAYIGQENTFPTLSKPDGVTIVYSSSNETAATIDANTGAITLGTTPNVSTTITATLSGDATYKDDVASYTLNVYKPVTPGTITYEENGGSEVADVTTPVDNFPDPLPEPTKENYIFAGWWTTSTFNDGTQAVAGAPMDGNVILYAKWTEIPVWAYTYTSNVTLSTTGGTSASAAKVKFYGEEGDGYDAIKAGTGSAQGAVVVNVPAGATALHFHAYGWKGEALTLSITAPTGVTVTPSSITLNSNDGITSNSPFTLTEGSTPQTDAYYALTLSGNTAAADLTFTATSGKRFVLFGVNQEGAVTLESISVSGTATALEYNDGDHFNPAGLGVTGHYSDASTAPITEGVVWAFDPDPLTQGTTSVSVTATAGGFTSAAFVVNGLTVSGAAPLSPWATVYTSNITLSTEGGTSASAAKVKFYGEEGDGYDAIKAGTGSVQGAVVVNVPAGATALHLHAYGWKGEALTLSITAPTGVTVTPSSITLNSNDGITSNSPFTLIEGSTPQTDAYYALSLSGNTDAIELTISATEGKRFVLFGVNQEGGIVPVLDRIEIGGTMTNTTGWKTGDNIIPEGLTVTAYYTQNDAPHHNTNVTASVTWSHAALVENQTEVTLTASYTDGVEKTANTNVTIEAVELGDPTITTDPATQATFTATERGAALPAAKTIAVTLKNIASATATLGGTNPGVFSLSKTSAIVDGDVISVSVVSTDIAVASYSATVTIKDANGDTQKSINIYLTINEPVIVETPVGTFTRWIPATEIKDGMEVLITGVKDEVTYAMGGQNSNNRSAVAASVDGEGVLAPGANTMAFTVVEQSDGTFALSTSIGQYLYASTSNKNHLRTQENVNENAKWTLTLTSAVAESSSNRNVMQFNTNDLIFSCYASASQSPIKLYVRKPDYERNVTEGRIGTICLPKAGKMEGVSLFQISYMDYEGDGVTPHKIYFDELPSNEMIAGRPYIFLPNEGASKLGVYYTSDETASAGHLNGLYGTLTEMNTANSTGDDLWNNFIFSNNLFYLVNSSTVRLQANRAYVKACDELPGWSNPGYVPSLPAPGLRRIGIGGEAPQVTTGMENVQTDDAQTTKVLINGQFFILRGEKMYDATGRLVK